MILEALIPTGARKQPALCCAGWLAAGILTAVGCASRQSAALTPLPTAAAPSDPAGDIKMTEDRFDTLYRRWQAHINAPRVQLSSNPSDYVECKPFRDLAALGQAALPRLIGTMAEGNSTGWKESQFFLWYAIKDISGIDLSRGGEISGQQEIALLYLDWWETRPQQPIRRRSGQ